MEMPVFVEHKSKVQKSAGRDKLEISLISKVLDLCYLGRSVVKETLVETWTRWGLTLLSYDGHQIFWSHDTSLRIAWYD